MITRPASLAPVPCLDEHPDFTALIREAATYHGLIPRLVSKDYWVTRVLRALAGDLALMGKIVFKGGTSLSKGWKVIDRFSEDVDILVTGPDFGPPPASKGAKERELKYVRRRIEADTPLRLPDQESVTRDEWNHLYLRGEFHCAIRYPVPPSATDSRSTVADSVLVEYGYRGGPDPHARRTLQSLVSEFLQTQPAVLDRLSAYAGDLASFDMDLLSPERTFAEKLLALHNTMSQGKDGARRTRVRHYYDIAQLYSKSEEVRTCLTGGRFHSLVRAAAEISNMYFDSRIDLHHLDLRDSPALNPSPEQVKVLRALYDNPLVRELIFRDRPPLDEILEVISQIRSALPASMASGADQSA